MNLTGEYQEEGKHSENDEKEKQEENDDNSFFSMFGCIPDKNSTIDKKEVIFVS